MLAPARDILLGAILSALPVFAYAFYQRLRRWCRLSGRAEPACGRCGYVVYPGSRRVCPECGSELASVGVFSASTEPPPFPVVRLWAAALLLAVGALAVAPPLAERIPIGWRFSVSRDVDTSRKTRISAAAYGGVFSVGATGTGRGSWTCVRELSVRYIDPVTDSGVLVVDPRDRSCRAFRVDGLTEGPIPFDRVAVERLVASAGFDPTGPEGRDVVDGLLHHADAFLRLDLPTQGWVPGTIWQEQFSSFQDGTVDWVTAWLLWLAGMSALVRRAVRRHRRRRAAAAAGARQLLDDLRLAA